MDWTPESRSPNLLSEFGFSDPMAPKRSRPVEDPSSSTSEEEEEEEEKKEEEGVSTPEESSEEEKDGQKNKSPPPAVDTKAPSNKLVATQSSSSEEEEEGSQSESESESDSQSRANIKPIEETTAISKAEASPVKPSTSKRQRETGLENKEAKRAKKKEVEPEEEEGAKSIGDDSSKKQMFQRIWSEEDELVFLKGIADYSAKHGCVPYPNGDMNEFHDSIRNSLHCEFSRGQLTDKIRRLKKKYENNVSRAKFGEDPSFHKRHELKAFELSKKIWGVVEGNSSQQSNKGKNQKLKAKEAVMPARKHSSIITDFARLNESVGLSPNLDWAVEIGMRLLSESAKADLEGKWEEIQEEEFRLYLKKVELIQMQVKAAMHAFRSRNH